MAKKEKMVECPCCGQLMPEKQLDSLEALKFKWGSKIDEEGNPTDYSENELKELDRLYHKQAAEFKGVISPRIDMALQEISINRLEWNRAIARGDSQSAKRFSDSVRDVMAREGMRAADGKPNETPKIDSIIVGLEKAGMVDQYGTLMEPKRLYEKISEVLMRKYDVSTDVIDAMMFSIINTMQNNNGGQEFTELPLSAQISNRGGQLRDMNSEHERKAFEEIGVMAPPKQAR